MTEILFIAKISFTDRMLFVAKSIFSDEILFVIPLVKFIFTTHKLMNSLFF